MTYKPHGIFTEEVKKVIEARLPSFKDSVKAGFLNDIVYLSRMGLLVEGANAAEQLRVNGHTTTAPVKGSPIPPIPAAETKLPLAAEVQKHFTLSQISRDRLKNVHPKLKQCVELAITISLVDFRVQQGERSLADQKKAVASGNSRTMRSKHLMQSDGLVHAVDLVVLRNGVVDWTFDLYAYIALAMDQAATTLGIAGNIRWGCAWDRVLSDFHGDAKSYLNEAKAYASRHPGSDLLDAPHFEWVK